MKKPGRPVRIFGSQVATVANQLGHLVGGDTWRRCADMSMSVSGVAARAARQALVEEGTCEW